MTTSDMTKPVVVVTGGAQGIGRGIVTRLRSDGWRVADGFPVGSGSVEPSREC